MRPTMNAMKIISIIDMTMSIFRHEIKSGR